MKCRRKIFRKAAILIICLTACFIVFLCNYMPVSADEATEVLVVTTEYTNYEYIYEDTHILTYHIVKMGVGGVDKYGDNVSYENGVLRLDNYQVSNNSEFFAIKANGDLIIELVGDNNFDLGLIKSVNRQYGIFVEGNLTIRNATNMDGNLNIDLKGPVGDYQAKALSTAGISANGNLTIEESEGGNLTISINGRNAVKNTEGDGGSSYGIRCLGKMEVLGSTIKINNNYGGENESLGIYAKSYSQSGGNIAIQPSGNQGSTPSSYGIRCYETMKIEDGVITIGNKTGVVNTYGIYTGSYDQCGGIVTVKPANLDYNGYGTGQSSGDAIGIYSGDSVSLTGGSLEVLAGNVQGSNGITGKSGNVIEGQDCGSSIGVLANNDITLASDAIIQAGKSSNNTSTGIFCFGINNVGKLLLQANVTIKSPNIAIVAPLIELIGNKYVKPTSVEIKKISENLIGKGSSYYYTVLFHQSQDNTIYKTVYGQNNTIAKEIQTEKILYYSVRFELNGHGNAIDDQSIEEAGFVEEPPTPYEEDYLFEGWYKESDFANLYNFSTKVTDNIILYAKWSVNHTPKDAVKENEVPATCTVDGSYDEVIYCSVCGGEISREKKVVTAPGHTPKDAVKENEVPATCTVDGSYDEAIYCSVCGGEISREKKVITAPGHTPKDAVKENEVAATCTVDGSYDEAIYCSVCGGEISRDKKAISAPGHTPKDAVKENEVSATCTVDGSYDEVIYCSVCGGEISRDKKVIPALDHTPKDAVKENEVPATCTVDGSHDEVIYCSVCGEEISREKKTILAMGHDVGEWEIQTPATENTDGIRVKKCTACDTVIETETITATGSSSGGATTGGSSSGGSTTGGSSSGGASTSGSSSGGATTGGSSSGGSFTGGSSSGGASSGGSSSGGASSGGSSSGGSFTGSSSSGGASSSGGSFTGGSSSGGASSSGGSTTGGSSSGGSSSGGNSSGSSSGGSSNNNEKTNNESETNDKINETIYDFLKENGEDYETYKDLENLNTEEILKKVLNEDVEANTNENISVDRLTLLDGLSKNVEIKEVSSSSKNNKNGSTTDTLNLTLSDDTKISHSVTENIDGSVITKDIINISGGSKITKTITELGNGDTSTEYVFVGSDGNKTKVNETKTTDEKTGIVTESIKQTNSDGSTEKITIKTEVNNDYTATKIVKDAKGNTIERQAITRETADDNDLITETETIKNIEGTSSKETTSILNENGTTNIIILREKHTDGTETVMTVEVKEDETGRVISLESTSDTLAVPKNLTDGNGNYIFVTVLEAGVLSNPNSIESFYATNVTLIRENTFSGAKKLKYLYIGRKTSFEKNSLKNTSKKLVIYVPADTTKKEVKAIKKQLKKSGNKKAKIIKMTE